MNPWYVSRNQGNRSYAIAYWLKIETLTQLTPLVSSRGNLNEQKVHTQGRRWSHTPNSRVSMINIRHYLFPYILCSTSWSTKLLAAASSRNLQRHVHMTYPYTLRVIRQNAEHSWWTLLMGLHNWLSVQSFIAKPITKNVKPHMTKEIFYGFYFLLK